ncbi:MAG: ABC transporter permease [Limnochordia bacterium]|jgi:putative ABC transport system permease protein
MSVILKIAFRNLRQHKTKTLIIGVIISIGIAVLVIGNSLLDTATAGIKQTYIENYTGHIIITGKHRGELSLFGSNSMDEGIPVIPEFETVLEFISSLPEVEAFSPQATHFAVISIDDEVRGFAQLFGIEPALYRRMFPDNLEIVEGGFLAPGEEGILLSEVTADQISRKLDQPVAPGDSILLTGMSLTGGTRVREVEIKGIFRFRNPDPQIEMVSLLDITNLRALAGMNVQRASEIVLEETEQALLGEISEQMLFGEAEDSLFGGALVDQVTVVQQNLSEDDLLDIFGGEPETPPPGADEDFSGAWHFLLLRLKSPRHIGAVQRKLNEFFQDEEIEVSLQGWTEAAGVMAKMSTGVKTVFNVIILIVAVVAVIIIMNTLVISVTERIPEIGTMRAIGAQRSFVRRMITLETILISGLFGTIGVVAGFVVLFVLNLIGIPATNIFLQIIFGGEVLRPVLSLSSVVMSLVTVTVIGVVASLYPVSIALKIQPVKAMQS